MYNPLSALTKDVTFLLESYQYTQLINEATRITQSSKTLIDHIYSNTTHMVNSSGVLHIGISDHSLIYCVRKFPSFKTSKRGKTIKYRCLKKFNLNLFLADLERVPWNNIFNFDDPNSMWTTWKSMFLTVYDFHAPIKSKRVKSACAPWLNKNLKELMFKRDALKRKASITSLPDDWRNYKQIKNTVNITVP